MSLTNLTSTNLRSIIKLVDQKEQLAKEIQSINAQLESFGGATSSSNGNSQTEKPARHGRKKGMGRPKGSTNKSSAVKLPKGRPAKATSAPKGKRGAIKEAIIATLKAAGKEGIHIDDLAKKAGSKVGSLNVWLYANRKKTKELKKLDKPGVWGWEG